MLSEGLWRGWGSAKTAMQDQLVYECEEKLNTDVDPDVLRHWKLLALPEMKMVENC
jgi:hypothetical protein